jgi:hypothetical protein
MYEPYRPGRAAIQTIAMAIQICESYRAQGLDLTLRQLYYQFVSRDLIPNNQREYDKLGVTINKARMGGYLDWDFIIDRTRFVRDISHWGTPAEIVAGAAKQFHTDLWDTQSFRVEVWIEKDALAGVLDAVCPGEDVPYFSCRGYTSQSEMWGAGRRIGRHLTNGQNVRIIHLGDHDPSGIDMSRDIEDRLRLFTETDSWIDHREEKQGHLSVRRIALNMDQVEQYDPPPNPAKLTDSRAQKYIDEYGHESWELDALEPTVLIELIRDEIKQVRDIDAWDEAIRMQEYHRTDPQAVSDNWDEIVDGVR